jgi:hypothetical protein
MKLKRPSPCDKASWHAGVGTVRTPPRPRPHLTRRNSKPSWLALFRTLLQGANHWDFLPFKLLYNRAVGGALLSSASRFGAAPGEARMSVTFKVTDTDTGTRAAPKAPSRIFNLAATTVPAVRSRRWQLDSRDSQDHRDSQTHKSDEYFNFSLHNPTPW